MRSALFALLTASTLALGVTSPSLAAEGDPTATVTFPDITTLNPDTTDYVVQVEVDGYDTVQARWPSHYAEPQTLDAHGGTTIEFPRDGSGPVLVYGCIASACDEIGVGPEVTVHRTLGLWPPSRTLRSPSQATALHLQISWRLPEGTVGEASWSIVPAATPEAAALTEGSGTVDLQADWLGEVSVPVDLSDLPEGDYLARVDVTADVDGYGPLASAVEAPIVVDDTPPSITAVRLYEDHVYPERDYYLDFASFSATWSGETERAYEVLDGDGTVVAGDTFVHDRAKWYPRTKYPNRIDAGVYTLRLVATDEAGNTARVVAGQVRVTPKKRLRQVVTVRQMSAKKVLGGTHVDRCSQLRSPSTHGGAGSLGFASLTRCRTASQSVVAAGFGAYLPDSFTPTQKTRRSRYSGLQISLLGGPARDAGRDPYLVMAYTDLHDRLLGKRTFYEGYGRHDLDKLARGITRVVRHDRRSDRYYVWWQAGLAAGSRYDLQKFRIQVKRWVLR
ncbi:hypothetical protein [Nocardioides acrostichi]|uniref:Ig-like domain-containing protein n=1 Tax=Nocardioides acrostichi TaxID=2784339 RepID=A0A930Y554_9ACTN|nr:hypothetical protein [Nocardioides acrostichi]MBF4160910.1 hypothetical protein [Nocardioides acrostichi]